MKYLELGTTKTGRDASISLWQPSKEWGSESYEAGTKAIGEVTGISFATGNLDATISNLAKKGIKVGETESDESGRLVEFQDVDGNTYFVYEERAKVRRAGLTRLDSITIASRDAEMTGEFFRRALGMRSSKIPATSFKVYRLHPGGTGLLPFTPTREMYPNPSDYESDLTHIGERTSIARNGEGSRRDSSIPTTTSTRSSSTARDAAVPHVAGIGASCAAWRIRRAWRRGHVWTNRPTASSGKLDAQERIRFATALPSSNVNTLSRSRRPRIVTPEATSFER